MVPDVPIGSYVERFVEFLTANFSWLFDGVATALETFVDALEWLLLLPPPIVMALLVGLVAWRVRSRGFALFTVLAFLLIEGMNLWNEAMTTLALVLVATVVAVALAVPLGILATRSGVISTVTRPVLDFMQTLPAFVYLIPAVIFFGIGVVPGAVATLIFAMPPAVRLTELGIRGVDSEIVEAAHAFGAEPNTVLFKIQIPLALPTIMAGINQVIMLALSMVVIAGMVGAGGLGAEVFRAITRISVGNGFEAGLAVVILAIFLDRITESLGTRGRQSTTPAA